MAEMYVINECDQASHPHLEDGPSRRGKVQCSGGRPKLERVLGLLRIRLLLQLGYCLNTDSLTLFLPLPFEMFSLKNLMVG